MGRHGKGGWQLGAKWRNGRYHCRFSIDDLRFGARYVGRVVVLAVVALGDGECFGCGDAGGFAVSVYDDVLPEERLSGELLANSFPQAFESGKGGVVGFFGGHFGYPKTVLYMSRSIIWSPFVSCSKMRTGCGSELS